MEETYITIYDYIDLLLAKMPEREPDITIDYHIDPPLPRTTESEADISGICFV